MTKLKTVKELTGKIDAWGEIETGHIIELLTQDRATILAVLKAQVKEIKEFMAVASSPEFEMGYEMAIKDYEERTLKILQETLGIK